MKKQMAKVKKEPILQKKKVQKIDLEEEEPPQFDELEQMQMEQGQMPIQLEQKMNIGPKRVKKTGPGLKLLNQTKQNQEKKVVAVIVSFVNGSSYDHLFTSVEQKSEEGTKVLVYACSSAYLPKLLLMFEEKAENDIEKELFKHINELHADCVVFNWECSSGYGGQTFTQGKANLFKFLKIILDRGHMAMFSDFSLKALINQWDSEYLGPNPFKKVNQTSNQFTLCFNNDDLKECPSAQLQLVGEMAEQGKCNVSAMGGTIVYSVNQKRKQTDLYRLQVLTVVSSLKVKQPEYQCKIGEKVGPAGHVLLSYKSGGHLLTSMGHWIQLMKIDTSEKKLFQLAQEEFGAEMAMEMQQQYNQIQDESERVQYRAKKAAYFVQNQAPCQNMSRKARKKR